MTTEVLGVVLQTPLVRTCTCLGISLNAVFYKLGGMSALRDVAHPDLLNV